MRSPQDESAPILAAEDQAPEYWLVLPESFTGRMSGVHNASDDHQATCGIMEHESLNRTGQWDVVKDKFLFFLASQRCGMVAQPGRFSRL